MGRYTERKKIGFESDSWYDGETFDVNWCFNEKKLNIYEAEAHRVVDCPLSELVIFLHTLLFVVLK